MCITRFYKSLFIFFISLSPLSLAAQDQQAIQIANEYFIQGEYEKAKALYEDLTRDERNIPYIHRNYVRVLNASAETKGAEKYLEKLIRNNPKNITYKIDLEIRYKQLGRNAEAGKLHEQVIQEIKNDAYKTRLASQHYYNNNELDQALKIYLVARKESADPNLYAIELANLYRVMNNKNQMVVEYLNFANANPGNIDQVKNMLQNYLVEEEDLNSLESMLFDIVQKSPENKLYVDLLIWVNLQQKNFNAAFIQARALEKRLKGEGRSLIDIGLIALENSDYESAIKVFEYVISNYKTGVTPILAKRFLIKSREEFVKHTYPVDKDAILSLVKDYEQLVEENGINDNTLEALRSKALLHAFYLDEKDSAIAILHQIIRSPRIDPELSAGSKIDLGDIYVLIEEPWESALLYAQVEKSQKDQPLGYEAKFRNARLSFYKGDFALAKAHLDVLKLATSREIANDAIALSQLIQNNTVFDTTGEAMSSYAAVELLLFQNRKEEALDSLTAMLTKYPGHSLTDEILYLQAKIELEIGRFKPAIEKLKALLASYDRDILGDDAFFKLATIYDRHLKDKEQAMKLYQEFLISYPGSIYVAEARKRFRLLRGDIVN